MVGLVGGRGGDREEEGFVDCRLKIQKFLFRLGRGHVNEVKVNYWQADRASLVSVCMKVGIKTFPGASYPEVPCVVPTCRCASQQVCWCLRRTGQRNGTL